MRSDSRRRRSLSAKSSALNYLKPASQPTQESDQFLDFSQYEPICGCGDKTREPVFYTVHVDGVKHILNAPAFASLAAEVINYLQVHVGAPDAPPAPTVDGMPMAVAHAVDVLTRNLRRGDSSRMAKAATRGSLEQTLARLASVRRVHTDRARRRLTLVKR